MNGVGFAAMTRADTRRQRRLYPAYPWRNILKDNVFAYAYDDLEHYPGLLSFSSKLWGYGVA
jgi:hypothetical protein